MHNIDRTLLHSNIDFRYEPIFFSKLALVRLLDRMIKLCFPNPDHSSYYLEATEYNNLRSWRMLDCVASIIVSSSQDMFSIHFHVLFFHHRAKIWVGCVLFYTHVPKFNY